jgi:predicted site-specific integrase-resolvase
MDTGTIIVDIEQPSSAKLFQIAVYARVSSTENKSNLESQAERLVAYSTAKGYQISKVVKEIGSGVNDSRPKFLALLADKTIDLIVVH